MVWCGAGLRSGTLPTPLIVGLGEAARVAAQEMTADYEHCTALAKRMFDGVNARVSHVVLNGSELTTDLKQLPFKGGRYPGNLNLSFAYVEGESLLMVCAAHHPPTHHYLTPSLSLHLLRVCARRL